MKFGIRLPAWTYSGEKSFNPSSIFSYVKRIEELGFQAIFVSDHILRPLPAYNAFFTEPWTLLGAISGLTERVEIGILVAPLGRYHPLYLSKLSSTVDYLTKGRFILGTGVGWDAAEYKTLGIPLSEGGKRANETIEILRLLWSKTDVSYTGEFFQLKNITIYPRPVSPNGPPIWIAGGVLRQKRGKKIQSSAVPSVLRRIVEQGNGWVPPAHSSNRELEEASRWIDAYCEERGRNPAGITRVYQSFSYVFTTTSQNERAKKLAKSFFRIPWGRAKEDYLLGTPSQVVERIAEKARAFGKIDFIIFNPLDWDFGQLELIAEKIVPQVSGALD